MAIIQIAHSNSSGHTPTLTHDGQLAINQADGLMFSRDATGGTNASYIFPPGLIYGMNLSNTGADVTNGIDIASGMAASDTGPYTQMLLSATLTKKVNSGWVVGSGNGGLDAGAVGNNTYHVFVIRRPDTGVVDGLFSLSPTAPTMPAGYTQKRRIGSIVRAAATNRLFKQNADEFSWVTPILDVSGTGWSNAGTTVTISVPTGIVIHANVFVLADYGAANDGIVAYSLDCPATSLVEDALWIRGDSTTNGSFWQIKTNTSGQIGGASKNNNAAVWLTTYGWMDTRGRFG